MADVIQDDVLKWAAWYSGPKFHALLCDPPYHLTSGNKSVDWDSFKEPNSYGVKNHGSTNRTGRTGFMGKTWDGGDIAFRPDTWAALAEHLLPGAFIMSFASSRGWHRLAVALEDAGLIIHPTIFLYAFGSGFPKATRIKEDGMDSWAIENYGGWCECDPSIP